MDIPALSMAMAQQNVTQSFSVAMLDKTLDLANTESIDLISMIDSAALERSVNPAIGGNIDICL